MSKCDDNIVKYLGITLLPQAGVALGMAKTASAFFAGSIGLWISNITLFAVLIYELIGPLLTKIALTKAGDIDPEGATSARHEHAKERGWHHHIKKAKSAFLPLKIYPFLRFNEYLPMAYAKNRKTAIR
jgi:hypothetical protein